VANFFKENVYENANTHAHCDIGDVGTFAKAVMFERLRGVFEEIK
jgi:hypothetical protein